MAERRVGTNEPIVAGTIYRIAIQFPAFRLLLSLPWAINQALNDFAAEGAQLVSQRPTGVDQTSYLVSFAQGNGIPVDSFAQTLLNRIRAQTIFQVGQSQLSGVYMGAGVGVGGPKLPPPGGGAPVPPGNGAPVTPPSGSGPVIGIGKQWGFFMAVGAGAGLAILLGLFRRRS